ncbi:MAG: hypothetical protein A2504_14635 [Bdellovibrionales bacterium RIFOXYD12_FULL_39_22]|nr:MAG: hypothetical protein A2385_15115 [Bdellovibrionales bacterium RIFOXYB1_FULL_39_21]OFZ40537.1 MAG: hypothetical protein A2485_13555 [Bdellovibrionales bacterium RIFOXYC12_FULL_39_17]OFZ49547.1 MAG: hypothetical protein A2404_07850 [Bdellovibrionales bacterium RIFOXYC1_FULL_39_130]OFZ77151.1 MAG: hypothetical protein A2560_17880 [Bdellovibrionales bacterium RIFOXYD1_FULL_39_84]OFZ91427.1 MAG: hypothetical protein A2504_14635 [Bdellovibrionales bacterium RIFOXYD12_FULL_39_22]HLE09751.1 be
MSIPNDYPQMPKEFWQKFYEVTQVPRPSKQEKKFIEYLEKSAKSAGLKYKKDRAGNVVIYKPATAGYENHGAVIIQSHMDMVCDKTPERKIDFAKDPIELCVEDGWVCANGTTLGADNGLGCAVALGLMETKGIKHPALELLFTVDEETGLHGALELDASMVKGKKLINLDTEEWGAAYIGCAGGIDYELKGEFAGDNIGGNLLPVKIVVGGLKGGHSGIDIHRGRGNAIKILADLLWALGEKEFFISQFMGGAAHNIIPRDAVVDIWIAESDLKFLNALCTEKVKFYKTFLKEDDQALFITVAKQDKKSSHKRALQPKQQSRLLNLLNVFPHGAYGYNWEADCPLVTHSSNLAIVKLVDGEFYLLTSIRYLEKNEVIEVENKIDALSKTFCLQKIKGKSYPSWRPVFDSPLLEVTKRVFLQEEGEEIKVKAIHAGLECGILKDKLKELDAISLGPNIKGVHSPSERIEIESTSKFWYFFLKLLESL